MEELHFVYINANGRIGVHSIQSISYSENHIQGICKNTDRIKPSEKTAFLNNTIHKNKPFRNARHSSPKTTHISLSSQVRKKIHSMCVSPDLRKQIKEGWLIRRMNKD